MTYLVTKTFYGKVNAPGYIHSNTFEEFMINVFKINDMTTDQVVDEMVNKSELSGMTDFAPILKEILNRNYINTSFNADGQYITLTREWDTVENHNNYEAHCTSATNNSPLLEQLNEFILEVY